MAKIEDFLTKTQKEKLTMDTQQSKAKQKRNHIKVKPVYLKKLVDECRTVDEAANLIGMAGSSVATALADTEGCRRVIELAAEYVYKKHYENNGGGAGYGNSHYCA